MRTLALILVVTLAVASAPTRWHSACEAEAYRVAVRAASGSIRLARQAGYVPPPWLFECRRAWECRALAARAAACPDEGLGALEWLTR